jgi:hypothetical protein
MSHHLRSQPNSVRRTVGFLALSVLAAVLFAATLSPPASAAPQGTSIGTDLYMTGATITGDGPENGRTLDSYQAAEFVQSWFVPSLVVSPTFQDPPADATRYSMTIGFDASENGNTLMLGIDPELAKGTFIVNYATDGTSAWISLPEQPLWPAAGIDAERADKWFLAEPATIAAFNGQGVLQATNDTDTGGDVNIIEAEADAPASTSTSSNSSGVLIAVVLIGFVAIVAGAFLLNRRRTGKV